jgi:hypothetical protein
VLAAGELDAASSLGWQPASSSRTVANGTVNGFFMSKVSRSMR